MSIVSLKNVVIMDFEDVENISNDEVVDITKHTFNTWQKNRSMLEKRSDTQLGKFAEDAVTTAFKYYNIKNYCSYDDFRNDNFELHAPFDGVFINKSQNKIFDLVNSKVKEEGSQLSIKTRDIIRRENAFTCEIKSTRLAEKYKERANFKSYDDNNSLTRLIDYLRTLDYLNYPHFTRYGDMTYDQYCKFVRSKYNLSISDDKLNSYVREIELGYSSDIFIRVFVDEYFKKVLIMGWIDRITFLTPPETHKLILPGKSELPLYFVKSLKKGFALESLSGYVNSDKKKG